jgi:hypothetical protein
VLVLERDGVAPEHDVFDSWRRPGIAQFRQPHNFLGLGHGVLKQEAPDVLDDVLACGALENRQYELLPGEPAPDDDAFVSVCARRPVFESALRQAVEREDGVEVDVGVRVIGLVADGARQDGIPRITGVRTEAGAEIAAEVVVDAQGRTSRIAPWLEAAGVRSPAERRSECGLLYYSRHFRFRDGVAMPRVPSLFRAPRGEIGYMAFSVFVEDNRTFCPVLIIPTWDRELRALRHDEAYMGAALSMPALVPWVHPDQAEPITPVLPMGSLQNLVRSLVVDGNPVAVGVQPVGDALCHTNPTFAFGASLAMHHGFTLAGLSGETDNPRTLALAFDDAVGADADARYDAVSAEDRDRIRLWRGEPIDVRDPRDSMALFLRYTAYPAAASDPDLFRAVARRVNLLDRPDALAAEEALVARAHEIAQAIERPPPSGPTRAQLLDTLAARHAAHIAAPGS